MEPENAAAVRLFRQMFHTQWRTETVSNGKRIALRRLGLDYGVLPGLAGAFGIALDERVMDGLRAMEAAALRIHQARFAAAMRAP